MHNVGNLRYSGHFHEEKRARPLPVLKRKRRELEYPFSNCRGEASFGDRTRIPIKDGYISWIIHVSRDKSFVQDGVKIISYISYLRFRF